MRYLQILNLLKFKCMQSLIKLSVIFCCIFLFACQGSGDSKVASSEKVVDDSVVENQALHAIFNRKSVRQYTEREISQDVLDNLLRAGMAAPSSRDRRPWHFIVISDKEILDNLGGQLRNAFFMAGANKAIVVCGDEELSDNCWFVDCSAVTQNILIAAESMGLGAVWTAVYPYDDRADIVRETFGLQKNIHAFAIIPLGYPLEKNEPKNKFDESRIHYNKW